MKRFPAEWEEQAFVQLTWPHEFGEWKNILHLADPCFAEIAKQISLRQFVLIVAFNQAHQEHIHKLLVGNSANLQNVLFAIAPSNDIWARDHAAITLKENNQNQYFKYQFNGWGSKYPSTLDNALHWELLKNSEITSKLLKAQTQSKEDFVLEGGSLETDGQGTLLTTKACLLNPNRNPQFLAEQIEARLKNDLALHKILWLTHGHIQGDDTDSHVDTIARFCSPNSIAYVSPQNADDLHKSGLLAMEAELRAFTSVSGKPYELFALPNPSPKYHEGNRLPATYANFLIINKAVLVPTYNDSMDGLALEIIQKAFPERQVVGINCEALIIQRGSLHCATMQFVA
jgi:agmatine deiminase